MRSYWFAGVILVAGVSASSVMAQSTLFPFNPGLAVSQAPATPGDKVPQSISSSLPPGLALDQGCCCSTNRAVFYASADYLLWTIKKDSYPPLVTSGSPNDTPDGALGQPGTRILFGGGQEGPSTFSGGRFTGGFWFDKDRNWAIEGSYFFLAQRTATFQATQNPASTTSLAVPFFDGNLNAENAYQVGLPGFQSGVVAVTTTLRFQGAEVNLRGNLWNSDRVSLSFLSGFRYLSLDESLDLGTHFDALPAAVGVSSTTNDNFSTRNNFYGGQVGLAADMNWKRFILNAQGKVALGAMNQNVNINGSSTTTDPINGTVTVPGGIFTGPSNLGSFNRTSFAVVPEVGINLGYQITKNWTATVGYTFLYASDVVRPGEQIDRVVNAAGTRPAFNFQSSDFWAQGVSFGMQFRY